MCEDVKEKNMPVFCGFVLFYFWTNGVQIFFKRLKIHKNSIKNSTKVIPFKLVYKVD